MRSILAVLLSILVAIAILRVAALEGGEKLERPEQRDNTPWRDESTLSSSPQSNASAHRRRPGLQARLEPQIDLQDLLFDLESRIDELDEPELFREMSEWTGIEEEILKRDGVDTRAFAKRLLAIASGDADRLEEPELAASVLFSSSLDERNGPLHPTEAFTRDDVRIHAFLPADVLAAQDHLALVRWRNESTGMIEMMQSVFLAGDAGSGYRSFSIRQPEGWTEGSRRVDIYGLTHDAPLLGTGELSIRGEATSWQEATSSMELLSIDAEVIAPLDALPSAAHGFRLGYRSGDDAGATTRMILTRIDDGIRDHRSLDLAIAPSESTAVVSDGESPEPSQATWLVANIDHAPFGAGLYEARLERDGTLLERLAFRILDRTAEQKKGSER